MFINSAASTLPLVPSPPPTSSTASPIPLRNPVRNRGSPAWSASGLPQSRNGSSAMPFTPLLWRRLPQTATCSIAKDPASSMIWEPPSTWTSYPLVIMCWSPISSQDAQQSLPSECCPRFPGRLEQSQGFLRGQEQGNRGFRRYAGEHLRVGECVFELSQVDMHTRRQNMYIYVGTGKFDTALYHLNSIRLKTRF